MQFCKQFFAAPFPPRPLSSFIFIIYFPLEFLITEFVFETYIYIHIFILDTLRVLYRNYCAPTPCPQNVDNQNAVLYCYYYLPFPTLFFFILIPLLTLTKVGHLENQVRKISRESEVPCCENSPEPSTLRPPYLSPLVFFFLFSFLFFFFLV